MSRIWSLPIALLGISLSAYGQLDTTEPEIRKMILSERKRLDCRGVYQQTRLKIDAQLKMVNKLEASAGLSTQTLANLNETTVALGQKRREFCELYKVTPELNKDDYFRVYGELDKRESDLDLIFRSATSKDSGDSLKNLKTIAPRETNAPADVNAALTDLRQGLSQMDLRVTNVETRIGNLESERTPRHLFAEEKARMVKFLSDQPKGSVRIKANVNAEDAREYAEDIATVLRQTGWTVVVEDAIFVGGTYESTRGLRLQMRDPNNVPPSVTALGNALLKSGIPVKGEHDPGIPQDEVWLLVGRK